MLLQRVLRRVKFFPVSLLRFMLRCFVRISPRFLAMFELELQRVQGKGFDGGINYEVKIASDFLGAIGATDIVVLDIGANVGDYSAAILRVFPKAKIFAFEPSSYALTVLQERFKGNDSVTIVPYALGSSNSMKTLWSDVAGSGLASLSKRRLNPFDTGFNVSEQVEVITLDSWVDNTKILPSFIKIDVEGHELDVLKGGSKTLSKVHLVQFEFGGANIDSRTFFRDLWYLLTEIGFDIYRISPNGLIHISRYSESDECFAYSNFFARKK